MVSEHNEKSVFGKALIITAVLFLVGVSLGMFLESQRTDLIGKQYDELQFEVLDSKLRSDFYQLIEEDFCEIAVEDNLRFSDRIYEDGKKIDIYDRFNRLGNGLDDEKRKYLNCEIKDERDKSEVLYWAIDLSQTV